MHSNRGPDVVVVVDALATRAAAPAQAIWHWCKYVVTLQDFPNLLLIPTQYRSPRIDVSGQLPIASVARVSFHLKVLGAICAFLPTLTSHKEHLLTIKARLVVQCAPGHIDFQ